MEQSTRLGLLSGFLSMIFLTFLYLTDPSLLLSYERLTLLIIATAMLYVMLKRRQSNLVVRNLSELQAANATTDDSKKINENQEFAGFPELLRMGFRTYVIAYMIKFTFVYFLFNYYDPSLIEMVRDASTKVYLQYQDFSKDTEEIIQQRVAQYRSGEFGPSLTDFLGIALELLIGFVMAFIFARLLRREQPNY